MAAWQGVVTDAVGRVMRREAADIRRAMKRYLGERSLPEFRRWLTEFYRDAPAWIKTTMMPVIASFATAIVEQLRDEVTLPEDHAQRMDAFVAEYADKMAVRHAARQRRSVEELLDDAADPAAITAAVSALLSDWEQHRYLVVGRNETVSVLGAVSKATYGMAGVSRLVWRANPGACPYCKSLDGRVVSTGEPFISPGDSLDPDGGTGPMMITGRITHPPLHDGCECMIVPG